MIGKSICAGMAISLGCIANLMAQDRLVGAVLFGVGLLAVCVHGLRLYTGTVCRAEISEDCFRENLAILSANAIGVLIAWMIFDMAGIETNAGQVVAAKMAETPLELFARAILCNILICIAVDEWKEQRNSLMVLFPVTVFVFCGFEHCIANLFYIFSAGLVTRVDTLAAVMFFLLNAIGNAAGGILFWRLKHGSEKGKEIYTTRRE